MGSLTMEVSRLNTDAPRSPASYSTSDSGRHNSLRSFHLPTNTAPPALNPPLRLSRKRAISVDTEDGKLPQIGDVALSSAGPNGHTTTELTREQVCLCQPDPKIPRPRNAFILYRQHYQAQVVAQHPGLANPEISKIIGDQWNEQAPEIKSDWKRLAEEEKQRHQRTYPGYRYQPKRAGKANGSRPISSTAEDPIRCPKCGGRYISTPSTPLTPYIPFTASSPRNENGCSLPPMNTSRVTEIDRPVYSNGLPSGRMDTPRTAPPHQQNHRRVPYPHPLQTHRENVDEMELISPSPDLKRRRFANERSYNGQASPNSYSAPQQFARSGVPNSAGGHRSQQLPGPGVLGRQGTMGPPQPSPMQQQQQRQYAPQHRGSGYDESLRLPPLQTQTPSASANSQQRPDFRTENKESQAKSIEAMVMTIPYINKVKVLAKISPTLQAPGPTSPAQETRGAVIAIEGVEPDLIAEIGSFIRDNIANDPNCIVKTWTTETPSQVTPSTSATHEPAAPSAPSAPSADTTITEAHSESPPILVSETRKALPDPFVEYLSTISSWHSKSTEIAKFITTTPTPPTAESSTQKILPVALLPQGFSLTTSDHYSLRIPINDSYAPVDHWQWMATLWRGIIGPDLTIFVKRVSDKEEMERMGGVELRSDCAVIVVRVPDGTGKMEEKTARRLGFEVLEIVRGVELGFGRK